MPDLEASTSGATVAHACQPVTLPFSPTPALDIVEIGSGDEALAGSMIPPLRRKLTNAQVGSAHARHARTPWWSRSRVRSPV